MNRRASLLFKHFSANLVACSEEPFNRELSMEAYLIDNPAVLATTEDEARLTQVADVEMKIENARKRSGSDGRIDILADYSEANFGIVELKVGEATHKHVEQLSDYLEHRNVLVKNNPGLFGEIEIDWRGVLVAEQIHSKLIRDVWEGKALLPDAIPLVAVSLRRFRAKSGDLYISTDVYVPQTGLGKSKTTFVIGEGAERIELSIPSMVLEISKRWLSKNPNSSSMEFLRAFPAKVFGQSDSVAAQMLVSIETAKAVARATGRQRHFFGDTQVLDFTDGRFAISSQWYVRKKNDNGFKFLEFAEKAGFKVKMI